MKTTIRNRSVVLAAAALTLSLLAAPVTAWSGLRDDIRLFHRFLEQRPKIAAELRANPRLVANRRYLEQREGLARFLRRHPELKREIVRNPRRVFGPYHRVDDRPRGWGYSR